MSAVLSDEFKAQFQKQLDNAVQSLGIKFEGLMSLLRQRKISYKLQNVKPTWLMVHKANRGGLGFSPFKARKNAAAIFSVGANKQKLDAAVAVELQPNGLQLDSIKRFNQILVSKSNGLLAPLAGEERYATLGCGRAAAFCKSVAVGGKHLSQVWLTRLVTLTCIRLLLIQFSPT